MNTLEAHMEPSRVITGLEAPFDTIRIDPREPKGLVIVGMAQSGKTALRKCISHSWSMNFHPEGEVYPFSNSNGFRGVTARAISELGYDHDTPVPDTADFVDRLCNHYDLQDSTELLDSFYDAPADDDILRSVAVDSAVPYVSENGRIRPHINAAGSRFIERVLRYPYKAGLKARPGLIIIDGRSQEECVGKFLSADVRPLGTFVLTCPEELAANRNPRITPEMHAAEVSRLQARNKEDRGRVLGRMTLPEDLSQAFVLHELTDEPPRCEANRRLLNAGAAIAEDWQAGAVVDTQHLTLDDERRAVELILWGALKRAELAAGRAA